MTSYDDISVSLPITPKTNRTSQVKIQAIYWHRIMPYLSFYWRPINRQLTQEAKCVCTEAACDKIRGVNSVLDTNVSWSLWVIFITHDALRAWSDYPWQMVRYPHNYFKIPNFAFVFGSVMFHCWSKRVLLIEIILIGFNLFNPSVPWLIFTDAFLSLYVCRMY